MTTMQSRTRSAIAAGLCAMTISIGSAGTATASGNEIPTTHPAGDVRTHDMIPWQNVGVGWMAADAVRAGTNTLILVTHDGQAYHVASLSKDEHVQAIAPDGRHVVTSVPDGGTTKGNVWDLTTGRRTGVLPATEGHYSFLDKDTVIVAPGYGAYERYSTTGKQLSRQTIENDFSNPVASPDGSKVSIEVDGGVVVMNAKTFRVERTLTKPKGASSCSVQRWTGSDGLTAACSSRSGHERQVYRLSFDKAHPTVQLTGGREAGNPDAAGWSDSMSTRRYHGVSTPSTNAVPDLVSTLYDVDAKGVNHTLPMPRLDASDGSSARDLYVDRLVGGTAIMSTSPLGGVDTESSVGEYDIDEQTFTPMIGKGSQFGGTPGAYAVIAN